MVGWFFGECIPIKDENLVGIILGAVLWNLWLERNMVIFRGGIAKSPQNIGVQIIATTKFWCSNQKFDAIDKLQCMLPRDSKDLSGGLLTISGEDAQVQPVCLVLGLEWRKNWYLKNLLS